MTDKTKRVITLGILLVVYLIASLTSLMISSISSIPLILGLYGAILIGFRLYFDLKEDEPQRYMSIPIPKQFSKVIVFNPALTKKAKDD